MIIVECLIAIVEVLFYLAPLMIQLILYQIAKRCFKKIPLTATWWICFAVNTFLLLAFVIASNIYVYNSDKMYAYNGIITVIAWAPCYIVILIYGIIESVKAVKSDIKEKSADNTDDITADKI